MEPRSVTLFLSKKLDIFTFSMKVKEKFKILSDMLTEQKRPSLLEAVAQGYHSSHVTNQAVAFLQRKTSQSWPSCIFMKLSQQQTLKMGYFLCYGNKLECLTVVKSFSLLKPLNDKKIIGALVSQLTTGPNKLECYILLGQKSLPGTNTQPYKAHKYVTKKIKCR